jgi:hypothetical protein
MDGDADGYGAGTAMDACAAPTGYVDNADDCDDIDAAVNPGASEVCDSIDNDCDSDVDDDDSSVTGDTTWYRDADSDGYGDYYSSTTACDMPSGYVDNDDDCWDGSSDYTYYEYMYYDGGDFDGYGDWYGYTCEHDKYWVYVSGDCDPNNAAIHPDATEVCDDEDNNCDGTVDGDDPLIVYTTWYYDGDEDGYGDKSTATDTCDPDPGYVTLSGDCDDSAYLVSPSRSEYCDGIDNNCNGTADETTDYVDWYRDDDGDHYGIDSDVINDCLQPKGYDLNGGDCDDSSTNANPGLEEACGDGVDNDCDTHVDNCNYDIDDSMFSISGDSSYMNLGYAVESGDLNGDGTDDLIVTSPYVDMSLGAIYIVNGASSGAISVADADAKISGSSCGSYCYDYLGADVATGDVNDDGIDDLLGGAAWGTYGHAYLFLGPVTSTTSAYADASSVATNTYTSYGQAVAIADYDGDGYADSAVGEQYDWSTSAYGNLYIYKGPRTGSSSADLVVQGETAYGYAGQVANVGDTDGDGDEEFAQAGSNSGSTGEGTVWVLDPGSTTGTVSASSIAMATLSGELYSYDAFGYKVAGGDYDGDGNSDVFVSAISADDGVTYYSGRIFGFLGPLSGAMSSSAADFTFTGDVMYGDIGIDLAVGDVTDDGNADVVIGAPYLDSYKGKTYVMMGPDTGSFTPSSAVTIGDASDATDYNGYVGYSVGTIGDWSGDDRGEVIIGGFYIPLDSKTYGAGRAWVVDGL